MTKTVLSHRMLNDNIELQHEEGIVSGSTRKYESVSIAFNKEKVLQGLMVNYNSLPGRVLEMSIHQPKLALTVIDFKMIFAESAVTMGVSLSQVRPAYYYDSEDPAAVDGLKTLAKMRQALSLE